MRKNLALYAILMVGFMSCNLDSKLSRDKDQKGNNIVTAIACPCPVAVPVIIYPLNRNIPPNA
ncbi:hypothetical protein QIA41_04870 (plasmid) [Borreliella sinica]|uniref:hypothetical protein n=1 Tax=Borreliella sinica TaxID=87162 RepID=UPI0038994BBA